MKVSIQMDNGEEIVCANVINIEEHDNRVKIYDNSGIVAILNPRNIEKLVKYKDK